MSGRLSALEEFSVSEIACSRQLAHNSPCRWRTTMLRKGFSIRDSQTKSRLSFKLPDVGPHRTLKRSLFGTRLPFRCLNSSPRACDSKAMRSRNRNPARRVMGLVAPIFPDVEISVVLAVRRRKGKIEFEILTWPSQTLRQRFRRTLKSPDCQEWAELCSTIRDILARETTIGITSVESLHGSRRYR